MTTASVEGVVPAWTAGDRLRKARELTGLDRKAFAAELDLARNTVTKYEKGEEPPRPLILRAWAVRCGVSARWLATGQGDPSDPSDPSVRTGWTRRRFHRAATCELSSAA